ncbi:hypothetical protein CNBA3100 [Cryptococcus deneoformans B-3501A]|uniref:hypothetical protein n=1 Tax=Cryptococcus deneoformans (strain B-3501A) TaxID=283643 RepID=UPI000042F3D6|nr:hypothetical protein CNBA3100 [Cryptococcus neoformans var. neoformans B-3501A]EAL23663.1 hypothetical protein CNBA3100 [Cryptococcus neoformans var. neoformans B-3501A]
MLAVLYITLVYQDPCHRNSYSLLQRSPPSSPSPYPTQKLTQESPESMLSPLSSYQHGATASTSLLDNEGYPRGDLDIYAIRHARSSLVRLQNDRQTVTDLLATALHDAFAISPSASEQQPNGSVSLPSSQANGYSARTRETPWPARAIAKVNTVTVNSPASEAGLKAQDVIYSFAGINHTSPGGLQAIGTAVAQSEGIPLPLLIMRGQERLQLTLTPRSGWGGRGSLGCHILPV